MGSGFAKKKKEARLFQEKMQAMQEKLKVSEAKGSAGGGLVEITLNGEQEMVSIKIKKECVDPEDIESLEDLIKIAYNQAVEKLSQEAMPGFSGSSLGMFNN